MNVSTIALATDDPNSAGLFIGSILFLISAIIFCVTYSRLFDSGHTKTLAIEVAAGVCGGLSLIYLLAAFW